MSNEVIPCAWSAANASTAVSRERPMPPSRSMSATCAAGRGKGTSAPGSRARGVPSGGVLPTPHPVLHQDTAARGQMPLSYGVQGQGVEGGIRLRTTHSHFTYAPPPQDFREQGGAVLAYLADISRPSVTPYRPRYCNSNLSPASTLLGNSPSAGHHTCQSPVTSRVMRNPSLSA